MKIEMLKHRAEVGIALCMLLATLPGIAIGAESRPPASIQQLLEASSGAAGAVPVLASGTTKRFYQARRFAPAWTEGTKLAPQASAFLAWLERLHHYGIDAGGYHLADLRAFSRPAGALSPDALLRADVLFTDAWLLVASHLYAGRINPNTIDPEWFSNRRDQDFAVALQSALDADTIISTLDTLHPPQQAYTRLVKALADYREIANRGGWPRIDLATKLEPGSRDAAVPGIRKRLQASGELALSAVTDPEHFDDELRSAVMRFQSRHGLEQDGVVGPQTAEAMNVPVEQRIQQLILNLERWRWFPQSLGIRHVLVNIAGFDLYVMEHGQRVLDMDVIVGRPYRRTPVFSGQISYLVFNPTWTVPDRLAVQDKLPLLKKDAGYLKKENFVLLPRGSNTPVNAEGIDWSRFSQKNFPYVLRQNPGPNNALGRVKFMFPNQHNVYLHDTPNHELFSKTQRAFSSGCIRLSSPLQLAELLLSMNPGAGKVDIAAVLATGKETPKRFEQPIPVHLTYWTAWAEPDGGIQFRPDLYGRDARLWTALNQNTKTNR